MLMLWILSRVDCDREVLFARTREIRTSGESVEGEKVSAKKSAQKGRLSEGYKSYPSSLAVLGPVFETLNPHKNKGTFIFASEANVPSFLV